MLCCYPLRGGYLVLKEQNCKREEKNLTATRRMLTITRIRLYVCMNVEATIVLKPVSKKIVKNRTSKITIAESRNALFFFAPTHLELRSAIKNTIDCIFFKKRTVQPFMCGVGNSLMEIEEYFVYFAWTYYKFDNIIKSLDICFKIYHVLNLEYANDCKLIWLFLQEYFYEMPIASNDTCTSLSAFLGDLRHFDSI